MTKDDALKVLDQLDLKPDLETSLKTRILEEGVTTELRHELQKLITERKELAAHQKDLIERAIAAVAETDQEVATIVAQAEQELDEIEAKAEKQVTEIVDNKPTE